MTRGSRRLLASVSLDLDNQWSYMKTHGDAGWDSYPSYLDAFVPHLLDVLDRLQLRITVFLVGQDAVLDKNREWLARITARGHEVGNHSFHHEPWIRFHDRERIEREVRDTEEAIEAVTGQRPVGYRGPGFSWNAELLEILARSGYLYDASTLPTYIGPLARMYYFRTSGLSREERARRGELFGTFADGRRPVRPYLWQLEGHGRLLEIPVTTMPGIKLPFHLSYLLYLSRRSRPAMRAYLATAIRLCSLTRTEPSFLLHPLDLLGAEQVPALAFFPGMDLDAHWKVRVFECVIEDLRNRFELVTMGEHARAILARPQPPTIRRARA